MTGSYSVIVAPSARRHAQRIDDWWRENRPIDVEAQPGVEYPACVAGQRACPPEDCGGTSGYEDLLQALNDPKHEEREELLTWLGGSYDPEAFTVTRANAALSRLARKRRKTSGRRPAQDVSRI